MKQRKLLLTPFLCAVLFLGGTAALTAEDLGLITKSAELAIIRSPGTAMVGAKEKKIVLVEYFDYNCPFCKKLNPALQTLLETDSKVALIYKDWPILSDASVYAAGQALAAGWQGKYVLAHDTLMGATHLASNEQVDTLLRGAGLDMQLLKMDGIAHEAEISARLKRNNSEAHMLGIHGTPGLLVGRRIVNGVYDVAGLEAAVGRAQRDSAN